MGTVIACLYRQRGGPQALLQASQGTGSNLDLKLLGGYPLCVL